MADFVAGVVAKVTAKDTKNGGKVYNICVDTTDNGEEWFGCGFDDPKLNEGDEIEFDIEYVGDYTNVNMDTLDIVKAAPQRSRSSGRGGNSRSGGRSGGGRSSGGSRGSKSSAKPARGKPSGGRGGSKAPAKKQEVDWDRKDNLIRLQSSQNTAVATIRAAIEAGAVALPAKKGEKFDAFQALVEDEAARLFDKYTDIVDGNYQKGGAEEQDDDEYDDDVPQ